MEPKKNPNIDSEDIKSRTVYVLSGLVLVIAFILCLVEYKKIDLAHYDHLGMMGNTIFP